MRLARALNILESDRRLLEPLGALHFLVAAAHSLFEIGAISLLIANLGPEALPQVYVASALLLILLGLFAIPLIDRLNRAKLFALIIVGFAICLIASPQLGARQPELVYRGLYVLAYLMKGLVFLQFWLLAGDLVDVRQAKRLFPLLLGFSLVGGLTSSLGASLLPRWLSTENLLYGAGVLLLLALVPVYVIATRYSRRFRSSWESARPAGVLGRLRADIDISSSSSLLRTISASLLLLAFLAQVLDFLMGRAANDFFVDASGTASADSLTTFYALLNLGVIAVGVLVQLTLANRLINSIGITRVQLTAPLTFVLGFGLIGVVAMTSGDASMASLFFAVLAARAVQRVLRISIFRSSTDLIFNAIPSERRGRAKAFKETVIEPLGVLLGGLVLILSRSLPTLYVVAGALALSIVFFVLSMRLKEGYVDTLVGVLKEKSRFRFAFPSMVMRQVKVQRREREGMVSGLRRALEDDEAAVRLLAVQVAAELHEPKAAPLLVDRVREEKDSEVRATMVAALGKLVRAQHQVVDADPLSETDPLVRASGMESLAQIGIADEEIEELPEAKRPPNGGQPDRAPQSDPSPSPGERNVGREAIAQLAGGTDKNAIDRLVQFIEDGDGATRHLAARALERCGESAVDMLTVALWSADVEARRYVIQALTRIGSPRAHQALLPALSLEAEEAYYDLVRLDCLCELPESNAVELLRTSIQERVQRGKRNAYQILHSVFIGAPGMRLILSNLNHTDAYVRSSAIEALETRVDASQLGGVLPLFEHENPKIVAEHGSVVFELRTKKPDVMLTELTRHRTPWMRACAVYALGQVGGAWARPHMEARLGDRDELTRLNAIEGLGRIANMDSVAQLEKIEQETTGRQKEYAQEAIARIRSRTSPGF